VGKEAFSTHGAHGAQKHVATKHFYTFLEAREYLKIIGCTICGIEIMEGASGETANSSSFACSHSHTISVAVHEKPFRGSTAFVIGNEVGANHFRSLSHESSPDSCVAGRAVEY
jgi:hypothetical protein